MGVTQSAFKIKKDMTMVCKICERRCLVPDGGFGLCGRYENKAGSMRERFPNLYLVTAPISAETMPVLHFSPRAKFLQISTTGCNFDCSGCISTVVAKEMDEQSKALKSLTPQQIINKAFELKCDGIVFLMNDPLASFYTFLEVCKLAKKHNLITGCSTNGYFTPESLEELSSYIDFINIGLKGLSKEIYHTCGVKSHKPVLRNIETIYNKGIHLEIACIHKRGNEDEVLEIAKFLQQFSQNIPLQLMRFIPIDDASIEDEPSIYESEKLHQQVKEILNFVYLFNSPGTECLNTYCPTCKTLLFERDFYGPMGAKLREIKNYANGHCQVCNEKIALQGIVSKTIFDENGFEGGYPMTRALEIVEGTLACLGVKQQRDVTQCWEEILSGEGLKKLHIDIQNFDDYVATIFYLGKLVGKQEGARELIDYMKNVMHEIQEKLLHVKHKPKVYYVMGKPLFALEDDRLENQLVELAGGESVNHKLHINGRPGRKITKELLNQLNPDIIFISSFLDFPTERFYEECLKLGINVKAVEKRQIYNHIAPCFDFGSPRWILGLMYIANILHPELFHFDIEKEADNFYKKFYDKEFILADVNRSFAKPHRYHVLEM